MTRARVCFLGSPQFALASLEALLNDEHFEVVGVVTQPDRPRGRNQLLQPTLVKQAALHHGIPVISPQRIGSSELAEIRNWKAEVAVVVAFGQLLKQEFLDEFTFGAVNVHGSVLPRWRGAAPIQRGIEFGDQEGGVSLQKMVLELDAGDVLGVRRVQIGENETARELHDRLAVLGADLLRVELMDFLRGNLVGVPQDASAVTYAKKISKSESRLNWARTAQQIHNQVRAFTLGPGTWTNMAGRMLKILRTRVPRASVARSSSSPVNLQTHVPGKIVQILPDCLLIATGHGEIEVTHLQFESKKPQSVEELVRTQFSGWGERFE